MTETNEMRLSGIIGGLAAIVACGVSGPAWGAQLIYGVDSSNNIITIDWDQKAVVATTAVGLGSAGSNGLALDVANNRLILQYSGGTLRTVALDAAGQPVGPATNLGGGPGGSATNATFYNGQYVYVDNNTNDLVFVAPTSPPSIVQTIPDFNGSSTTYGFGDVAVDASGILYGSSNQGFFSYDLNSPGSFNPISGERNQALQLAALADGTLVGVSTSTGLWYTIDKTTGARTLVDGLVTVGINDLASNAVPEPASIAMMGTALVVAGGLARRRRLARAA